MSSADIYCAACGAANTLEQTTCFACGQDLSEVEQAEELLHGRYRMLGVVGQGGFAHVHRAEDTLEGRIVAVKAIHLKALSPQEMIDATDTYNRELHFGALLNHPALPKIYDSFTDQHTWYIVAEFIDGQTLEDYMQRSPARRVPADEVIALGMAVCEALTYLHSRQPPVIFRDIKPDNIMLTPTGRVYLIDFGIARQLRPQSRRDTQALGSPGYASPEQYGKAQTNERSDIYSLGATLRTLLTGKNPLDAEDEDLEQIATTQPDLVGLLTQMLSLDPAQRPASAERVRQRLQSIVHPYGILLRHTASTQPAMPTPLSKVGPMPLPGTRKTSRPLWQRTLVAAAVLCILGGLLNSTGFFSSMQHIMLSHNTTTTTINRDLPVKAAKQTLTLSISNSGDNAPLDPIQVLDPQTTQMDNAIYEGLVQLDSTTHIQPQLAASWQRGGGEHTWTFHLRPNLKFSDGSPLTSRDVAFSFDRALDPALHSPMAANILGSLQDADLRLHGKLPTLIGTSILTPDPATIVLKTSSPIAFLPSMLTAPCALVLEKSLVNKYGAEFVDHLNEGGASGPFKFAGRTASDIDFVPNPYYQGAQPQLTKLSFAFFNDSDSDSDSSYRAYLTGQVALTKVSSSRISELSNANDFHEVPQLWMTYYAMNYLVKPFDNVKIRQAFALALDKQSLADTIRKKSVVPTNHIIPMGEDGFNPALTGPAGESSLHGNPTKARWLLQDGLREEGLQSSDKLPPIIFSYSNSPQEQNEAAAVQKMWQTALGINVHLQALPTSDLFERVQKSVNNPKGLQFWRSSWASDYPDAWDWTTLQFGRNSPENTVNYGQNSGASTARQRNIQQILQNADRQTNYAERIRLYQEAEQHLVNDVAWLPLYQQQDHYLLNPNVQGYKTNVMGTFSADDWSQIYITE